MKELSDRVNVGVGYREFPESIGFIIMPLNVFCETTGTKGREFWHQTVFDQKILEFEVEELLVPPECVIFESKRMQTGMSRPRFVKL